MMERVLEVLDDGKRGILIKIEGGEYNPIEKKILESIEKNDIQGLREFLGPFWGRFKYKNIKIYIDYIQNTITIGSTVWTSNRGNWETECCGKKIIVWKKENLFDIKAYERLIKDFDIIPKNAGNKFEVYIKTGNVRVHDAKLNKDGLQLYALYREGVAKIRITPEFQGTLKDIITPENVPEERPGLQIEWHEKFKKPIKWKKVKWDITYSAVLNEGTDYEWTRTYDDIKLTARHWTTKSEYYGWIIELEDGKQMKITME